MTCEQRILASLFLTAMAALAGAQEKPLPRRFTVGAAASYRIQLIVRSELQGQQAEAIGAKTYVKPFTRAADDGLAWTATRRILSVGADGGGRSLQAVARHLCDFGTWRSLAVQHGLEDREVVEIGVRLLRALTEAG